MQHQDISLVSWQQQKNSDNPSFLFTFLSVGDTFGLERKYKMNALSMREELKIDAKVKIPGPLVTKELIHLHAVHSGFADEPHILGEKTILSRIMGEEIAFMCGCGTDNIMHIALSEMFYNVWKLEKEVEKMELKKDITFLEINPEGGVLETEFTVRTVTGSHIRIGNEEKIIPSTIVVLACTVKNIRSTVARTVLKGTLTLQFA